MGSGTALETFGAMASDAPSSRSRPAKRIAIFIVAYNAASTLRRVLDRIPPTIWDKVEEVFVFDDSSHDDTFLVGLGYKAFHGRAKLRVFRNRDNQGYGGNQILGYKYAIEQGFDIVALLHGDGQYAPEALPELLAPLERGDADAVFGSRMMEKGAALRGGMPLYKYVGNRILTSIENAMLDTSLSEFHSGYRLYSMEALKRVPFERNTHEFHFDTQIIIQLKSAGLRILEIPIPTYYGDEICYVDGLRYARNVIGSVAQYQLHNLGLRHYPEYDVNPVYHLKRGPLSSHSQLLQLLGSESRTVLDVGCGTGELAQELRERGHYVVGIDSSPPQTRLDEFYQFDVVAGSPLSKDRKFDVVLLADVLEHVPNSEVLLELAKTHLTDGGRILVSLPNAVHWSVRAMIAAGNFDYTNKGILDRTHLRFFTRASALRLFEKCGLEVAASRGVPVPWENIIPRAFGEYPARQAERIDYSLVRAWPNLFSYQHIFDLRVRAPATSVEQHAKTRAVKQVSDF